MLLLSEFFSEASAIASFLALIFCCTAGAAPNPVQPPIVGKLVAVGGYRVHIYCTGYRKPRHHGSGRRFRGHNKKACVTIELRTLPVRSYAVPHQVPEQRQEAPDRSSENVGT